MAVNLALTCKVTAFCYIAADKEALAETNFTPTDDMQTVASPSQTNLEKGDGGNTFKSLRPLYF